MRDVKKRYLSMGSWHTQRTSKRPSRTGSALGRIYIAVPPPEGWPGGQPERDGLRGRAR